jgi:hypothetical protein
VRVRIYYWGFSFQRNLWGLLSLPYTTTPLMSVLYSTKRILQLVTQRLVKGYMEAWSTVSCLNLTPYFLWPLNPACMIDTNLWTTSTCYHPHQHSSPGTLSSRLHYYLDHWVYLYIRIYNSKPNTNVRISLFHILKNAFLNGSRKLKPHFCLCPPFGVQKNSKKKKIWNRGVSLSSRKNVCGVPTQPLPVD